MSQRAVLAGVNTDDRDDFEKSIRELEGLAEACDIEVAGTVTQNLEKINTGYYLGPGKIDELAAYLRAAEANMAIFNDELSPTQIRNLEAELDCEIWDRTSLILEIFARRAKTREAKLQVEVAHLQYMLPRLIGLKKSLEQQTGGVGTTNRGAGEKKLELNRRQIQNRISHMRVELEELAARRQTQRKQRRKAGIPVVSLVGYTNAGKSTIMNTLLELSNQPEDKHVFEKDLLFATLETSVRTITLPDNKSFLLTDTVGFIDKLPHNLIKAFRSTLEEVAEADLLIHVVDCSDPDCEKQMAVTESTLEEIGVSEIPIIYAMNKADRLDITQAHGNEDSVYISAKNKTGIDGLIELIREHIFEDYVTCEMLIPYKNGDVVSELLNCSHVLESDYVPEGTRLKLECRKADFNRYKQYLI